MFCMAWIRAIDPKFARVAWWFKAKWPDTKASFDDILRFPHLIARSSKRWQSPQSGFLKFNVDGAA
ncbi:hypothetical protein Goshw_029709 [Gossypium schwendimanii]|uniref:Uncharacterized protein n=1 Tax=Gossypium schwendimanii TaxID=34291 RepID=A0A7J9M9A8_GOSSC|nr:hypothetical protein [Gossypium schwendimanii]